MFSFLKWFLGGLDLMMSEIPSNVAVLFCCYMVWSPAMQKVCMQRWSKGLRMIQSRGEPPSLLGMCETNKSCLSGLGARCCGWTHSGQESPHLRVPVTTPPPAFTCVTQTLRGWRHLPRILLWWLNVKTHMKGLCKLWSAWYMENRINIHERGRNKRVP